jgi:SWI/SNF-related matrix-associated actin-dependent regulator of chromatin subfamily A member 5
LIQKDKKPVNAISKNELMDILSHGIDGDIDAETNMSLEEILKKGEDKTKELEEKIQNFKIIDSKHAKIDLYQLEGQNYSKRKIHEFIEANAPEESYKPKRSTIFFKKTFKPLFFP